ncbi:MAG: hypothetical protein GXP55_06635, partial [Deltaproteobacteria bacterium]|nr:hypothetical protein [Deltaproteobacteria bacterium]
MTDLPLRPHPRLALRLLALTGLAAVLGACGGGPQCVVDTHCKIDERCVERRCVAIGPQDAGVDGSLDGSLDAGPRDSGADTGPRDSGSLDAGPPPTGQVMAFSDQADVGAGPVPRTLVTAAFSQSPAGDCTTRTVGGCTLTQCPDTSPPVMDGGVDAGPAPDAGSVDSGPVDAGPPPVAPNAGVIVVTAGGPTATLPPAADGSYAPFTAASLLWPDGSATVNFQAFGTSPGVPGFMQSVPAPTSVTLTSPDLSTGTTTVTRLAGVDLAWTGTTAGVITVLIGQS